MVEPNEPFRLALVTCPEDVDDPRSRVSLLLPALRATLHVDLFFAAGREREGVLSTAELRPRTYAQILYVLRDEARYGFMAHMVRATGGAVYMPSWGIGRLACAAYPELIRPGWRGFARALREGGPGEAMRWRREGASSLALNRSIVRHADAFLVSDPELGERIEADRGERTPIGHDAPQGAAHDALEPGPLGARWAELLRAFPEPRAARRALVLAKMREAERRRAVKRREQES